jgi:uncharacterized protein YyaL (SSP411 family)
LREAALSNRLARESSPYLLLHAENPVDWYPWGEEAFEKARREDRPIFLSVGYSTCYWCHVMERESFSDPAIADALNEGYVSIKLDREERPDLDEIYMAATQLLTRSGGWPNSLFLTPDLKPFFAGTYFPPRDAMGRPGFSRILASLREAWALRRAEVLQQAATIAEAIQEHLASSAGAPGGVPDADVVSATERALAARFDPVHGGFGRAPKFPSPSNLFFLLDRLRDPLARAGEAQAREMLVTTLDRMARGGIQDHLAGGFHRYSTDALWLVPHFEKMLYDNAALARLYAEADALAPGRGFAAVARSTLEFVLAEMTGPDGEFHSAIDAETDGHEGAYYTWTAEELRAALSPDDHALLGKVYGFDGRPNFESTRYVLHLPEPLAEAAVRLGVAEDELRGRLEPGRRALLAVRGRRPRPLLDDKVLADWNGLMIGAFARVSVVLGEPRYLGAARRAAEFVLSRLASEGMLLHAWRSGRGRIPAFLDDYAFLVEGLLRLFEATGEERWKQEALRLQAEQDERVLDASAGGYFAAGEDPRLLFRSKPAFDGAVASGNGFAALNLLELAALSGDPALRTRAEGVLGAFSDGIGAAPLAHVTLVRAVARLDRSAVAAAPASPVAAPSSAAAASARESLEDEAREAVEVVGRLGSGEEWKPFAVELKVAKGWHLYANAAGHPSVVSTSMAPVLGRLRGLRYPEGEPSGSGAERVFVYRERVRFEGEIEHKGGGAPSVALTYQACDESRCLPPITRLVRLQ